MNDEARMTEKAAKHAFIRHSFSKVIDAEFTQ
jgi:hypothetical protein